MFNNLFDPSYSLNEESINMSLFTPFVSSTQQSHSSSSSGTETCSGASKESFEPKFVVESSRICKKTLNNNNSFNLPNRAVKRKFPGPAGILPDENITLNQTLLSQTTASAFESLAWSEMSDDFKISTLYLYDKFHIAWLKKQASLNRLVNQKSPFLAATLHFIEVSDLRPKKVVNVTLKDMTGEIQGTILYSLYEERKLDFTIGSVLVLKDFGVLSCKCENCDNFYLTITPNNLAVIYSLRNEKTVDKIVIVDVKVDEVITNYTRERQKLDEIAKQTQCNSVHRFNTSIRASGNFNSLCKSNNKNIVLSSPKQYVNSNFKCSNTEIGKNVPSQNSVSNNNISGADNSFTKHVTSLQYSSAVKPIGGNNRFNFKKSKTIRVSENFDIQTSLQRNSPENCSSKNTNSSTESKTLNSVGFSETIKMGSNQVSVTVNNKEHAEIWRTLLEDVDVDSLFGEF